LIFLRFLSESELASEDTTSHGVGTLKPKLIGRQEFHLHTTGFEVPSSVSSG
jgi:hypothetical protein